MPYSSFTNQTVEATARTLGVDLKAGLNDDEIAKRRVKSGGNEITGSETLWWHILARQWKSPFTYLLLGAALLSFFLGETVDGLLIALFIMINVSLGFYQEYRSEKSLQLLKNFLVAHSRVRRAGQEQMIPSRELVPGDIVILETGDIIPADVRWIELHDTIIDEAILTGESAPVDKVTTPLRTETSEAFQAKNIGFSGTTVVSGKALGIVVATGRATVIGNITHLTTDTRRVTAFEKRIASLSRFVLQLILVTLAFVFVTNIFAKHGAVNIIEFIVFSVALAISVVPEALPVVTTFSLSRGALRLAQHKVVVKRLAAVEELGSIDVLCTDKTGTLTENTLTVRQVLPAKKETENQAILVAALAAPFLKERGREPNNAFDIALWNRLAGKDRHLVTAYERLGEIPFDPERRRNTVLLAHDGKQEIIVRGALDEIMALSQLTPVEKKPIRAWAADEGLSGHRVIAIAKKSVTGLGLDQLKEAEQDLAFVGCISFADPLKATAKEALAKAKRLGVAVKILTGDSAEVAGAVAEQVGLISNLNEVMTGEALMKLSVTEQKQAVEMKHVFARVSPEEKFHIIELLKEHHDVGFLGEGINDAPALKMADVGIVVSGASDIAREAADIVLLKHNLQVVIDGIQEGRAIFANITKYIRSTLASNLGNFYTISLAIFLIDYLPMLPIQILLVNLFTDFPMIAVATDRVDHDELRQPKSYDIRDIALFATVFGLVSTVFDFIFFFFFSRISPESLHTYWFIGSILTELVFMFIVRTRKSIFRAHGPSRLLLWLSVGVAIITVALPYSPWGAHPFQFLTPTIPNLLTVFAIVLAFAVVSEAVKMMFYRFLNNRQNEPAKALTRS